MRRAAAYAAVDARQEWADTVNTRRVPRRPGFRSQAGFGITGLAIIVIVMGLLIVPVLRMTVTSVGAARFNETRVALEIARDALISFAAAHGGCLPFASDFEGGVPDTDATGAAGTPDTGDRSVNQNAGDLPWADLGLGNSFLDGDNFRIQFYVASPYTDKDASVPVIECDAGFRGFQWDTNITYNAPSGTDVWVYDYDPNPPNDRVLYEIKKGKSLAAFTHPSAGSPDVTAHPDLLPANLLEVRRGPDVTSATGGQNDVISAQNVFVLIAAGENRNADLDRAYFRDSTHTGPGLPWAIGTNFVDDHIFSITPNVDATDQGNNGDDTIRFVSFTEFRAGMSKYSLNVEPVCETPC